MQGTDSTYLLLGNVIKSICRIYFFTNMWFFAALLWSVPTYFGFDVRWVKHHHHPHHHSGPKQECACRGAHSAGPARTLQGRLPIHHCICPVPTPRPAADSRDIVWRRKRDAPRPMAESNPLRGFPRLRRAAVISAGRLGGGRLQTGRWYCSRKRKRGELFLR